ncbi:MAG: tetratricopeptide repeat protein, partial [Akkermansiaceae bacterium]|nr:tetratricopeptide repeat protein [Verrucomicrobiales bacterium]
MNIAAKDNAFRARSKKQSQLGWLGLSLTLLTAGCERPAVNSPTIPAKTAATVSTNHPAIPLPDSTRLVLVPLGGESALDKQIALAQQQVRGGGNTGAALEKLGWLFVSKARVSFDPGFHKLAEQCALSLEELQPGAPEALLLRGHVLQNLHRFQEAEPLARQLVAQRGRAFDHGLLGDVLMEQGRLNEAIAAYQQMADLKPDLHAYTRAAHVRWLKGDLEGAVEMIQLALSAASPRDAESAAWVYTRMAIYQLQAGQIEESLQHSAAALEFQKDYPPALLVRGRCLLAGGKFEEAIEPLKQAAALNPLPEYQWTLAEALRAANRIGLAEAVEQQIKNHGATADPRTFSLFLATRGENFTQAIQLAEEELSARQDVFTQDALAWALAAAGRWSDAVVPMRLALAEGTRDARLFLHAGIIASRTGDAAKAEHYFTGAHSLSQTLLPSEQAQLEKYSPRS